MIKFCKNQWSKNRERLEEALRDDTTLESCDYKYLLSLVVENIFNPGLVDHVNGWSSRNITAVDNGDYHGTLMFLIPRDCYQPAEWDYLMTFVDYGSCSGCDTLMSIQRDVNGHPTESQLKNFMALCLTLVENTIKPYNGGWMEDKQYNIAEWEAGE